MCKAKSNFYKDDVGKIGIIEIERDKRVRAALSNLRSLKSGPNFRRPPIYSA